MSKLKAVVELSVEEQSVYKALHENLVKKLTNGSLRVYAGIATTRRTYSTAEYQGVIPPQTIELLGRMPSDLEVSMMCDNGFSHFGGNCHVDQETGKYVCTIYTD